MSQRPPLAFIFTVTLTGILNNTLVTPAIPDIIAELRADPADAGLLVAAGSVAGIVIAPLVGFLADRFGRRIILVTCLAIFGICGLGVALAPTFELLLAAKAAQGIGSAGLINLAVVLIGDHWTGEERTRLVGRNAAVLTVGLATMPLVSGAITQAAGWRVAFGLYPLALVTATIAYFVLDRGRPHQPTSPREQLRGAITAVRRPEISVTFVVGLLVFVLIFGLFLTVFPLLLADRFGMEAGARGMMISLPAVSSTLVAFNLGRIRTHLSVRSIVMIGGLGLTGAFFLFGASSTLFFVAVGALAYGASEGSFIPTLQDYAMASTSEEHRGAVMAGWVSFARFGQTIGPLMAGLALTVWDPGRTLMAGAVIGLVIFAIGRLGPVGRRPADSPAPG